MGHLSQIGCKPNCTNSSNNTSTNTNSQLLNLCNTSTFTNSSNNKVFYKSEKKNQRKVWFFSFLSILAAAPPREETSRRSAMQPLAPCCWLLTGEYAALTAYHPAIARPPPSFACLTQLPLPRSRRRYYLSRSMLDHENRREEATICYFS
jgi:hypothetical protein